MKDGDIIALYWARSEAAVAATAEKYGPYCYSISYNILHNNEDAEECVNDAYLGAWSSMPPNRPNRLAVYLGRITRNLALNRFKGYHTEKRGGGQAALALSELEDCVPAAQTVEEAVEEQELVRAIERFLHGQPRKKRDIFIRRYWYFSPIRSIAEAYGMGEGQVASLLFGMRGELRRRLEKEGITL